MEEYYVEHNGKLVGILAEDVIVEKKSTHPSSDEEKEDEEGGKQEYEKALQTFNNDMHGYMGYAGDRWTPSGPVDEKGQPKKPNPADYGLSESEEDEETVVSSAHGARPKLQGVPILR